MYVYIHLHAQIYVYEVGLESNFDWFLRNFFRLANLNENQLITFEREHMWKYSVHVYLSEFIFSWVILDYLSQECFY